MGASLNLALPEIAGILGLDEKKAGWVNSSFLIATAIFQVPLAKIADLIGRKKVFLCGVAVFGVFSVACAFAWNFASLMVFRALAGLGGAMIFGTNLAILSATYEDHERGKAMGILTSVVYMALALGPFLGGMSTHYLGWRSVFYIPGIVLILQTFSIPFLIKREWVEENRRSFDVSGSMIYGIALFSLLFGFSELPNEHGAILAVVGVLLLMLFYHYERTIKNRVFQVSLFGGNRAFTLGSLAAFLSYMATMAVVFMVSLYLQNERGLDAKTAGLILISSAVAQSIAAFYAGKLADRFEASKIAALGMGLNAIGLIGLIFMGLESPLFAIVIMLLFLGLGFGLFASPNTKVIMGSVEKRNFGQASATIGTMRLTGQAFSMGVAIMSFSLFENFMQSWQFTFAFCAITCIAGTYCAGANRKKNACQEP
jgi:EmrB/QacA subfamily drug resistance transporter